MKKIKGVYLHCATCVRQNKANDLEIITDDGLRVQVWCRRHSEQVAMLRLDGPLFDGLPRCQHEDHERQN